MTATQLRKLLKGVPGNAQIEVQVLYDEPEEWDGTLRTGHFVIKETSGREDDILFLESGYTDEDLDEDEEA